MMKSENKRLMPELEKLLRGGSANVGLNDALANLPQNLHGKRHQQIANHTAYHVAEIIMIRRLLYAWPS